MSGHLHILEGPDKGEQHELRGRVTLGHHPSNTIALQDAAIDDHQAEIEGDGEVFRLRNLAGSIELRVNGELLSGEGEIVLRHGDLIEAGATICQLDVGRGLEGELDGPDEAVSPGDDTRPMPGPIAASAPTPARAPTPAPAAASATAEAAEREPEPGEPPSDPAGDETPDPEADSPDSAASRSSSRTVTIDGHEVRLEEPPRFSLSRRPFASHASFVDHLRQVDRPHTWLEVLYRIGVQVSRETDARLLFARVLDILIAETDADRGVVLYRNDGDGGSLRTLAERGGSPSGDGLGDETDRADADALTIAVLESGEAVVWNRPAPGGGDGADDDRGGHATSLLAVPLLHTGTPRGVVQLHRTRPGRPAFSARQLDLVAGAALQLQVAVDRIDRRHLRRGAGIEEELRNAERIQQFFLPKRIPEIPGVEIVWRSFLSHGLGGDYYDLIELENGRVAFVIGDVSGHSIGSALVLASVRTLIRRNVSAALSPAEALAATNDFVKPELPPGMFVTLFLGILDPADYTLVYSNAGHNHPLLYRRAEGEVGGLVKGGLPIGVLRGSTYEEEALQLGEGDALLLYTDALVESKDAVGAPFGIRAVRSLFERLAERSGQEVVDGLCQRLLNYHLAGKLDDDLTILALRVDHVRRNYRFRFPSATTEVTPAAERVARMASELGFVGTRGKAKVRLALIELIANAVEHGNRYEPATGVTISVSASAADLHIKVRDEGAGFDVAKILRRNPSMADLVQDRGRGLIIVREMMGMPRFNETGNEVTIVIDREHLKE